MSEGLARTPLYDEHLALGARMVPFAGYEMPVQYAGIIEEHRAVRTSAGHLRRLPHGRVPGVRLRGVRRAAAPRRPTTCTGSTSSVGAVYTLMCDETGGIIDDLIVYHTGELEYLIIANAANRDVDVEWMTAHLPDGVEFVDESDRTGLIALQGPEAVRDHHRARRRAASRPVPHRRGAARRVDARCCLRAPATPVRTASRSCAPLPTRSRCGDCSLSFPEVTPCGLGARDTLRLEMGYPLHGSDMDRTTRPAERRPGVGRLREEGRLRRA